jgi:VIT1/CCC1 family predicted Fe2+/Mn2+ transporter
MEKRMRQRKRLRKGLTKHVMLQLLKAQENEITEYFIYSKLANQVADECNKKILKTIANEEKKHSDIWKKYTKIDVKPKRSKIIFHTLISKLLGLTFTVKLMEKGEKLAQINYGQIAKEIPAALEIEKEENAHEQKLLGLLDEERLKYVGSMVLGVNDALVELTGALAGLTLALQDPRLIATTGLITGIAASLSMGASEYLSTKAENSDKEKDPFKASIYTGGMYVITVLFLITPYFLFSNIYLALLSTLTNALLIILLFTFYLSVAQDVAFKKRFFEMAGISLGVSTLTFAIGFLVRTLLKVEV